MHWTEAMATRSRRRTATGREQQKLKHLICIMKSYDKSIDRKRVCKTAEVMWWWRRRRRRSNGSAWIMTCCRMSIQQLLFIVHWPRNGNSIHILYFFVAHLVSSKRERRSKIQNAIHNDMSHKFTFKRLPMSLIYLYFPFADNDSAMNTNLWLLPSATNEAKNLIEHIFRFRLFTFFFFSSMSFFLSRHVSIEHIGRMGVIEESLFDSV